MEAEIGTQHFGSGVFHQKVSKYQSKTGGVDNNAAKDIQEKKKKN